MTIERYEGAYYPPVQPARRVEVGPVRYEVPASPAPSMGPLHADATPSWRQVAGNVALVVRLVTLCAICLPVAGGGFGAFLRIVGWLW